MVTAAKSASQMALHMVVAFGVMYAVTGSLAFGGLAAQVVSAVRAGDVVLDAQPDGEGLGLDMDAPVIEHLEGVAEALGVAARRLDEARQEIRRAIECNAQFGHASEPWRTLFILAGIETDAGNMDVSIVPAI